MFLRNLHGDNKTSFSESVIDIAIKTGNLRSVLVECQQPYKAQMDLSFPLAGSRSLYAVDFPFEALFASNIWMKLCYFSMKQDYVIIWTRSIIFCLVSK